MKYRIRDAIADLLACIAIFAIVFGLMLIAHGMGW